MLTLIERTSGEARGFHIDDANAANIMPIVKAMRYLKRTAEQYAPELNDIEVSGAISKRIIWRTGPSPTPPLSIAASAPPCRPGTGSAPTNRWSMGESPLSYRRGLVLGP